LEALISRVPSSTFCVDDNAGDDDDVDGLLCCLVFFDDPPPNRTPSKVHKTMHPNAMPITAKATAYVN
jgi:hypothetical protein